MKHPKQIVIWVALCLLLFTACSKAEVFVTDEFYAMNTYITVRLPESDREHFAEIRTYLKELEGIFSRTDPNSEIFRLNHAPSAEVSKECADVLERSLRSAADTCGAFNPCLGALSSLWDVTGKKYIPTDAELAATLPLCAPNGYTVSGQSVVKEKAETELDLGAVVKGYAAGELLELLKNDGVTDALINLGGNVAVLGHAPGRSDGWSVGIKNPFDPESLAASLVCTDTVLAVSGDYERYFECDGVRYHHIFDGSTGKPSASDIKSCAVLCSDGFTADMLSTALFVMGSEKAYAFYKSGTYSFEAIFFTADGSILLTDGLCGKVTLLSGSTDALGEPLRFGAWEYAEDNAENT